MFCLHIAHMDIRMSAILISMKLLTSARLTMVSLKFCFFPACISCSFFILSGFRHPALRFSAAQCVTFFNNRTAFFAVQCAVLFNCAMCSAFQLRNVQCFSTAQCAVLFNCTFPTCCLGIYYRTLWLSIAIRLFHYTHSRSLAITFFDIPVGNFDFPYCAHRSHFQKAALQGAR